jgi:predicted nucleic acid-binding protein
MRKLRLYLDTSVISMIASPQVTVREVITKEFFRLVAERPDEFELVISPVVIEEIDQSPEPRLTILVEFLDDLKPTILQKTNDVSFLVEQFFEKNVLGNRHYNDLTHIAYAIAARCDYIISWNFRHFVNYRTISRVSAIVKEFNYGGGTFIVSPETFVGEHYHEINGDSD